MKTVAVYAGHQQQFFNYLEEHVLPTAKSAATYSSGKAMIDGVRYIFVSDVRRLRGIRNLEIVRYGTWMNRDDIYNIGEMEKYCSSSQGRQ